MIVGSGIDVIEIARIERALARRGERFARRVFASREIAFCQARGHAAAHFAVRFAVKEAVMKAVGTGWARGVRWIDIETLPGAVPGVLGLKLHGRVAELAAERAHNGEDVCAQLAVSRSRSHAMALVLLESVAP